MFVPGLSGSVSKIGELFQGLRLLVAVRKDVLELREESLGVLAIHTASLLPEVAHTSSFPRRQRVVGGVPVVFRGERRFRSGAHSI